MRSRFVGSHRLLRLGASVALAAYVGGCEIARITIPEQSSTVVVHAVLSSTAPNQTILVERSLTGEVTIHPYTSGTVVGAFSSLEQVLSDGGNPEEKAVVEIVTPSGQVIVAPEFTTFTALGNGAGMYRANIAGASLVVGGRYQLRVRTARGEVVTAETVVPGTPTVATATPLPFNRTTEQLALAWAKTGLARAYEVRVDNPFNSWIALTDSTHITVSGMLRNIDTDNLTHVFIPGFRQNVTVSAVDSNLYDYYRTVNSGFTGAGIVNRMKGGFGVFGSYVTVLRRTLDVTATQVRSIEGVFDLVPRAPGDAYGGAGDAAVITLYVESPGSSATQSDAITGSYAHSSGNAVSAAIGTLLGDQLRLGFLRGQALADTLDVLRATLRGDTLVGTFSKGAPARYQRRKP